ncbi:hypothetical protein [Limnothrix redekei]|uniref:Uncharacterized protein n=1 Tax=Limnothrix redekei LRLZ20PSL1 TaxID=3112953 RepID=A0ABW7CEL7_9CYAN
MQATEIEGSNQIADQIVLCQFACFFNAHYSVIIGSQMLDTVNYELQIVMIKF